MREAYLQFCDVLAASARFAIKVLMAAMTVDVLLGVFFRYVVQDALTWTEETARYLMIWTGFIGTGLALREGNHVAVEFLIHRLSGAGHRALIMLIRILSLGFLASVIGASLLLLPRVSTQRTPALAISMLWPYLAVPMGCLLTAFEMVALMMRDPYGRGRHEGPEPGAAPGTGG